MISNNPKFVRRIIAEDPNWNLYIVPPLSDICLSTLIKSFSSYPVLKEIADIDILYAHKFIQGLPPNLPLTVTVPLIDNHLYWKNLYLERWNFCENIHGGDLWKQCYLERYLSELIEKYVRYYSHVLCFIFYLNISPIFLQSILPYCPKVYSSFHVHVKSAKFLSHAWQKNILFLNCPLP